MSDLDTVTRIELTPVNVPFKAIVRQAMLAGAGGLGMAIPSDEPWLGGDFVICRLETGNGTTGLGEAYIWLPETGQTTGQIIDVIKVALHRYVIGENPGNFKKIKARMDVNVARNEVAKGLLDIALYDLVGKLTNKPVHEIIGGKRCETLPLAALVPLGKLESMVEYALVFKEMGYKTLRVKLGTSIQDDATIMAAIRDAVGPKIRLRVDYNQAYAVPDAITAIQAIEPFDIDVAEQPVAMDDYLGMKTVQERVKTPLMAHEGCLVLAATNEGLGTCWVGYFDEEKVKSVLNVPARSRIVAITPLGYPDEEPKPTSRKAIDEIAFLNEYGAKYVS